MFQQFLKWREEKYERERAEERHDKRYEYEEDKRLVELEFWEFLKFEKFFDSYFFLVSTPDDRQSTKKNNARTATNVLKTIESTSGGEIEISELKNKICFTFTLNVTIARSSWGAFVRR